MYADGDISAENEKKIVMQGREWGRIAEIMSLNMQDRSERKDGEQNLAEDGGTDLGTGQQNTWKQKLLVSRMHVCALRCSAVSDSL